MMRRHSAGYGAPSPLALSRLRGRGGVGDTAIYYRRLTRPTLIYLDTGPGLHHAGAGPRRGDESFLN